MLLILRLMSCLRVGGSKLVRIMSCTNDTLKSQMQSYDRHICQQSQGFVNSIYRFQIMYICTLSLGPLRRMLFSKAYTLHRVYSVHLALRGVSYRYIHNICTVLKCIVMKTKVGHEWHQLPAPALLFRSICRFFLFKETPSFKVDKTYFNVY